MAGPDSGEERPTIAPLVGPEDPRRFTDSGIAVEAVYSAREGGGRVEDPGVFPFTRGIRRAGYRDRPWTMRQYAGYASASESNERYRYLLAAGSTGLSMAFDLPTQLGLDSDDPRSLGEVGRTGVAIDTVDDMRAAFDGIPLDGVSTSMTINAPASVLLCLYELVAEGQGVAAEALRGTSQNDILKEYIARGNYIYPPGPSMRLTTDLFAYCHERIPRWNTISISGYHYREMGASAVQEVAFTLASAIAYVDAAIQAGLVVDEFAPRLAFFFGAHNNVFQEVAKFRAARRMWARIMRERFGARDVASHDAAFSHPDRRCHADRAAAAQQHRSRGAAGLLRGLWRHPVAAHQRLRRGARAAQRGGGEDRAAHPAGDRARVGRERHHRPVRRLVLRRDADRRNRGPRERADRGVDRRAARSRRSRSSPRRSTSRRGATRSATAPSRTSSSASTATSSRTPPYRARCASTRHPSATSSSGSPRSSATATATSSPAASTQLRDGARGPANLLTPIREALRDHATLGEVCGTMREVFGSHQPR